MNPATQAWAALRAALQGIRSSPVTGLIAVVTIGLCLLLVGAFGLIVTNMESLLDGFGQDIRVSAYLDDGLPAEEQAELVGRVQMAPGVESVELVTKEQALARFRDAQGERAAAPKKKKEEKKQVTKMK